MTTLAAGNTVSFSLGASQSVSVVTTPNSEGVITLDPLVPGMVGDSTTTRYGPMAIVKTFGPYGCPCAITLAPSVQSINYTVNSNSSGQTAEHLAMGCPVVMRFPNWPANTGFLLASLAASSTASRTGGVVTVTATGHGITTGTTYVGFRFYYPGSPSLVAGWYDSILTIPDANTITFSAAGADFGSESINGASAWTTATDIISMTVAGNTLKDGSKLSLVTLRGGDTVASNKTLSFVFGGSVAQATLLTTSPFLEAKLGLRCLGTSKQFSQTNGIEAGQTSSQTVLTKDVTADQTVGIRGTLVAASMFITLISAHLEIIQ